MLDVSENSDICWGLPTDYQNGKLNRVIFLARFAPPEQVDDLITEFGAAIKPWMGNVNLNFFSYLRDKCITTKNIPEDLVADFREAGGSDSLSKRIIFVKALHRVGECFGIEDLRRVVARVGIKLEEDEREVLGLS